MAKHHISAVLAAFLLASSLPAAEIGAPLLLAVKLGPEVALSSSVPLTGAVYDQLKSAVASNGTDYLAVWVDGRRLGSDIYATRVRNDAKPVNPLGIRIGSGSNPRVASAGGDYLVVWQTATGMQALRVSADGAPLAAAQDLGGGEPVALLSNGSTYLLIHSLPSPQSASTILDRNGAPLHTVVHPFGGPVGGTVRDGRYVVYGPSALVTITDDGASGTTPFPPTMGQPAAVAFSPTSFLLAWSTGAYLVFGYDGSVIKPVTMLTSEPDTTAAAWDGSEFLLAFGGTRVFRITSDGIVAAALSLSKKRSVDFAAASNGVSQLILWSELRDFTYDVVARTVPVFSMLGSDAGPAELITYSGEAQSDVQVARGPNGMLAAWDNGDPQWTKVSVAFNGGTPVTLQSIPSSSGYVGWPAVAAGNHVFLVVWRNIVAQRDRLLAKRFDFNGTDLDPTPLVVTDKPLSYFLPLSTEPQIPSIAFDGAHFHVSWGSFREIGTYDVGESGPQVIERGATVELDVIGSTRALWAGSRLLVGYSDRPFPTCNLCLQPPLELSTAVFDRFGTTASKTPSAAAFGIDSSRISGTLAPSAATFAFFKSSAITVARTGLDGSPQISATIAPHAVEPTAVEIDWNGSEYVLAWLDRIVETVKTTTVKAMRVDKNFGKLDAEPFEVSPYPSQLGSVWLLTTPEGVAIAYSRIDEGNGEAPRAVMRTLDRLLPAAQLPDLTVSTVAVTPSPASAGKTVTVAYRILNQGFAPAAATTTRIEIVRDADGTIVADQDFPTEGIDIGAGINQTQTVTIAGGALAGDYTVYVTVDRFNAIAQSTTANDSASAPLPVLGIVPCTFSVDAQQVKLPSVGGSADVHVTASRADCAWTAERKREDGWFALTATGGTGSGGITIIASRNPSATEARTATITVAGASVVVHQDPVGNQRRRAVH